MIIRENMIKQEPFGKVLKENGDMIQYFQDKYQPWLKNFKKSIKENKMSDEDIIKAINIKVVEVNDNDASWASDAVQLKKWLIKGKKNLKEAFQTEQLLSMKLKDIKEYNNGDKSRTLQDLNQTMSSLQGTEDKLERKAYFKAKKFYTDLVDSTNKED